MHCVFVTRLVIQGAVPCAAYQLSKSRGRHSPWEEEKNYLKCDSSFIFFYSSGLIQKLQAKMALHGVKLVIHGLETKGAAAGSPPTQKGLQHILTEICRLELNGNLHSELEQIVTQEKMHLQDDPLLNGLLDSSELKTCLDVAKENTTSHRMKIVEVS